MDELELTEEVKTHLRQRQGELLKIVEAYEKLEASKEWTTLKELLFSKSLAAIERQLLNETLANDIKTDKLYRLQGEWSWAKQYNDSSRFVEMLKKQLEDINKKLK